MTETSVQVENTDTRPHSSMVLLPPLSPRQILQAIYGPNDWRNKAARAFGVAVTHISHLASGRRALTRRHLAILAAASDWAPDRIRRDMRAEQERVRKAFEGYEARAREARDFIARHRRKGLT